MFYADWCAHCRNMEHAYIEAAAKSHVPFVKVSGVHAPVSSSKFAVSGYPTIFGTNMLAPMPHRFNNARTSENLLEFASQISPKLEALKSVDPMPTMLPTMPMVPVPTVPTVPTVQTMPVVPMVPMVPMVPKAPTVPMPTVQVMPMVPSLTKPEVQ